jgi:hypothetical protein
VSGAAERVFAGWRTLERDHPRRPARDERRTAELARALEKLTTRAGQSSTLEDDRVAAIIASRESHDVTDRGFDMRWLEIAIRITSHLYIDERYAICEL